MTVPQAVGGSEDHPDTELAGKVENAFRGVLQPLSVETLKGVEVAPHVARQRAFREVSDVSRALLRKPHLARDETKVGLNVSTHRELARRHRDHCNLLMMAQLSEMLEEVHSGVHGGRFTVGVAADLDRDLPHWKRDADFIFTQISFDPEAVGRWRGRLGFSRPVYAGVVVLASEKMARRLAELIPGLQVPESILRDLARLPDVGVDLAVEQILRLRDSGQVDGVHLIPARRYRQTAEALERAGL